MRRERAVSLGGEHRMQHEDDVLFIELLNCTTETCMVLLSNVIEINSIEIKIKNKIVKVLFVLKQKVLIPKNKKRHKVNIQKGKIKGKVCMIFSESHLFLFATFKH